jgi:hypothetical protein
MKTRMNPTGAIFGAIAFAAVLGVSQAHAAAPASTFEPPEAATKSDAAQATAYIPRVSLRDLPLFDRVLSLDEAQRSILESLIMDVEAAGATRESLVDFRSNLEAVLSDTQAARLEEAWRTIFRERMEAAGAVAGENVDVGALALAQMRGESNDALERAFQRYRAELGPLLDAREAGVDAATESADAELLKVRLNIRRVNDAAVGAFVKVLPAQLADDFRREVLARAYPTAHGPSYPLEALRKLADEFTEGSLRSLLADADTRIESVRERAVAAIRLRDDARVGGEDAMSRAERAIRDSEKEYEEFDAWLCASVQKVLTAEQLNASEPGRDLLAFVRGIEGGAQMAWDDKTAVIARFDGDGNGQIDEDEGARALNAFARSVGRNQRRRL